jgi:endonuclease III
VEPHKNFSVTRDYKPSIIDAKTYFADALRFAEAFYDEDMQRISSVKWDELQPSHFFEEYVWVVCATGFSAKAVSKFIRKLVDALGWFDVLANEKFEDVFKRISPILNNRGKVKAFHETAKILRKGFYENWGKFKQDYLSSPDKLKQLPYIGKVTCYHLARNIGLLDYVKPDLHLVRMAKYWGYSDCVEMCKDVQPSGMPLGIVDYVFWIAASTFSTLEMKQEGDR